MMARAAAIRLLVVCATLPALVSCGDLGAANDGLCVSDSECGRCSRCANGRCLVDLGLPTCVLEADDPCDGADNDGNGIIDDPDACWAKVFGWSGPDGVSCHGLSPLQPPAACAGYVLHQETAEFALLAWQPPLGRRVRQCSLGLDHALVVEAPLFSELPEGEPSTFDAWESAGYDCSLVLGWTPQAPPDLGRLRTPEGMPRPLTPFDVPLESGGTSHAYVLGEGPIPPGGVCLPGRSLWVFGGADAGAMAREDVCPLTRCAPRATGRLLVQTPESGGTYPPGTLLHVGWRVQNTGELTWPAGWNFSRAEGHWSDQASRPLTRDVAPGESEDFEIFVTVPDRGLDLRERWELLDDDGALVVEMELRFSVAIDDAAALISFEPELNAQYKPGQTVTYRFEVENTGTTTWNTDYAIAHRAGTVVANDLFHFEPRIPEGPQTLAPGESQVIEVRAVAPAAPGRYVDTWSVRNDGARDIPITAGSEVVRTFDTVIDVVTGAEGLVRATAVREPLTLAPGTPFFQAYLIENVGGAPWRRGWSLKHVSGALSRVDAVSVDADVASGERVLLVIPMRAPLSPPEGHGPWRDGWELRDASQELIGLSVVGEDGTPSYGARDGAWLWTVLNVGQPCEADAPAR